MGKILLLLVHILSNIHIVQQQCIIKYADFMHFWVNASMYVHLKALMPRGGFSIKDQSIDAIPFFVRELVRYNQSVGN